MHVGWNAEAAGGAGGIDLEADRGTPVQRLAPGARGAPERVRQCPARADDDGGPCLGLIECVVGHESRVGDIGVARRRQRQRSHGEEGAATARDPVEDRRIVMNTHGSFLLRTSRAARR